MVATALREAVDREGGKRRQESIFHWQMLKSGLESVEETEYVLASI
jgi:hypothetical protein